MFLSGHCNKKLPYQARGGQRKHGGVAGAGRQRAAQLDAVVGQVAHLLHRRQEVEGRDDHRRPHQPHVSVEGHIRGLVLGPGERGGGEEAGDASVDQVAREEPHGEGVPQRGDRAPREVEGGAAGGLAGGRGGGHGWEEKEGDIT